MQLRTKYGSSAVWRSALATRSRPDSVRVPVFRERSAAADIAERAASEQQPQLGEHDADRVVGVVDQQRAAVPHPRTPPLDVRLGELVPVGPVDVEHVDRGAHLAERVRGAAAHVTDAALDAGRLEIRVERRIVGVSELTVGGVFVGSAVVATVGVDCDELDGVGGRLAEDDRRPATERADLDNPPLCRYRPGGIPQPPSLRVRHPALHVGHRGERVIEGQRGVDAHSPQK